MYTKPMYQKLKIKNESLCQQLFYSKENVKSNKKLNKNKER